jgi:hypothetical protein
MWFPRGSRAWRSSNNPSPMVAMQTLYHYNKLSSSLRALTNQVDFMHPVSNFIIISYYYYLIRLNTI